MFQFPPIPRLPGHLRRPAWILVAIWGVIELVFQLSDMGVLQPALRWQAYREFAFHANWFQGWMEGYRVPPQTLPSLVTYSFLHGGLAHYLMNAAVFLGLSFLTIGLMGQTRWAAACLGSAVGGSVVFGLLSASPAPMVGASGIVFGLLGALKYAELVYIRKFGGSMQRFYQSLFALALLNLILFLGLQGMLAWQTHLGGFAGGWIAAWAMRPRSGRMSG